LVLGSLPRLQRSLQMKHALLLGAGLCILANSRPYEGFLLGLIVTGYLFHWWIRQSKPLRKQIVRRQFVPAAALVAGCFLWMGYYFYRVTGNPFEMPYQTYIKQYAASPAFVWQRLPAEPVYRDPVLRDAHRSFIVERTQFADVRSSLTALIWKLRKLATFYMGPVQIVFLLALPWLFKGKTRILTWTALLVTIGIMLTIPMQVHYAAPIAGAIFVLGVQSIRYLWVFRDRNWIGRFAAPGLPALILLALALTRLSTPPQLTFHERADLVRRLQELPGNHLVVVHYGAEHASAKEWVYNTADIDAARTVWARDMGKEENRELFLHFPDRKAWLLEPDLNPPKLSPYH